MMEKQEIVNGHSQTLAEAKIVLDTFTEEFDREAAELEKMKSNIQAATEQISAEQDEKKQLEIDIPKIEKNGKNMNIEKEKLKDDRVKIQEKIGGLQVKLNEAKSTGGEQRQRNKVFDYIMNHLKKKQIVKGSSSV